MQNGMARILATLIICSVHLPAAGADDKPPSVFEIPRIQSTLAELRSQLRAALHAEQFDQVRKLAEQAIDLIPFDMSSHYDLARAHARMGNTAEALKSLRQVMSLGLPDRALLEADPHFAELRSTPEFAEILELTETGKRPEPTGWKWDIQPSDIKDGVALVSDSNTGWNMSLSAFNTFFSLQPKSDQPVIRGHGPVGRLLRSWYAEGTAAGNHGDLYDNHDADHSNLAYRQFPQLTRIEYEQVVQERKFHNGLQNWFLFNTVVLGNSSTAVTGTPMWRSQPRLAYTDARSIALLYIQYRKNQLYVYPEHKDHDPGHNGLPAGYGDVFPANTPYTIVAQGSSHSDRPFLDAVACTLAAFHPQVKSSLIEHGLLMPTVQMIMRRCYREVKKPADYLTGRAHPTVFNSNLLDVEKMVRLAHKIKPGEEPPLVQLQVVEEDQPIAGRDFFHSRNETLFDTPCAIARVRRSTKYWRRMVVSAEQSLDINQRPLRFRWLVLRGDRSRVKIKRLNDNGSRVELQIAYHERRRIQPLANIASNRVDIGVIVDNGIFFSAPAFVCLFGLDNEQREYDEDGRIQSVHYSGRPYYVDPFIDFPKRWRDDYLYDEQNRLLGWTRTRESGREDFTAEGALVLERDESGRPTKARTVAYTELRRPGQLTVLEQQLGNELLFYEYDGDARVGRVARKEFVSSTPK